MKIINCVIVAIGLLFLITGCKEVNKTKGGISQGMPMKAVTAASVGDTSYHKAIEIQFKTASNYTWKAAATAPSVRSVEMSFATGVTNSNTFKLWYTRNNITRDLLTVSGTMHTITWYVPSTFYPLEGDVWQWSNSAAGKAVLTINVDYIY